MSQKAFCKSCGGNIYFGLSKIECDDCGGSDYTYDYVTKQQFKEIPSGTGTPFSNILSGSIGSGQTSIWHFASGVSFSIASGMIISNYPSIYSYKTCKNCSKTYAIQHVVCGSLGSNCSHCGFYQI